MKLKRKVKNMINMKGYISLEFILMMILHYNIHYVNISIKEN